MSTTTTYSATQLIEIKNLLETHDRWKTISLFAQTPHKTHALRVYGERLKAAQVAIGVEIVSAEEIDGIIHVSKSIDDGTIEISDRIVKVWRWRIRETRSWNYTADMPAITEFDEREYLGAFELVEPLKDALEKIKKANSTEAAAEIAKEALEKIGR